jgi:hypothetical protein
MGVLLYFSLPEAEGRLLYPDICGGLIEFEWFLLEIINPYCYYCSIMGEYMLRNVLRPKNE